MEYLRLGLEWPRSRRLRVRAGRSAAKRERPNSDGPRSDGLTPSGRCFTNWRRRSRWSYVRSARRTRRTATSGRWSLADVAAARRTDGTASHGTGPALTPRDLALEGVVRGAFAYVAGVLGGPSARRADGPG